MTDLYGLYIHIPYCRSKCSYCDFYSVPGADGVPQAYIEALQQAFFHWVPRDDEGRPRRPETLYFGGGTPSLLTPEQVGHLIQSFNPAPGAEVTLEANPAPGLAARLGRYREAGVNRLSLGVQSARDESLRLLGRPHTAPDARRALAAARDAGFKNISGDIMLALPDYSRAEFDDTLQLLKEGGAAHVSAYLLKIEAGTPFGKNPPKGMPGGDETADFYLYACERLERAGYPQYEISNFARPGFEGRHNLIYWDCREYLGLGPGAHSCLGGRRFSFSRDPWDHGITFPEDTPAPGEEGILDAGDYIMLRLRLRAGLDPALLKKRFGVSLTGGQLALLARLEKADLALRLKGNWALTPKGMLVQNQILSELL